MSEGVEGYYYAWLEVKEERDALKAKLAEVEAERDEAKEAKEVYTTAHGIVSGQLTEARTEIQAVRNELDWCRSNRQLLRGELNDATATTATTKDPVG